MARLTTMAKLDFLNLIQLITEKHKTKARFCAEFGINRSTLHKWQRRGGEVSSDTIDRLCDWFCVERYVLDVAARDIDENLLYECILGINRICEEAGVDLPEIEDRTYWAVQLYKQRAAGKSAKEEEYIRRALTMRRVVAMNGE